MLQDLTVQVGSGQLLDGVGVCWSDDLGEVLDRWVEVLC